MQDIGNKGARAEAGPTVTREQIDMAIENRETQDIRNYFVGYPQYRVVDVELRYQELLNSIYFLFCDTHTPPSCRLINLPPHLNTNVDIHIRPVSDKPGKYVYDYNLAYAMIQITAKEEGRCVRILINKRNSSTVMVSFLHECEFSEDGRSLESGEELFSYPAVLNLIATPSMCYVVQYFLNTGIIQDDGDDYPRASQFTH